MVCHCSKFLSCSLPLLQILIKRELEDATLENGLTTLQDIKLEIETDTGKADLKPIKEVSLPKQQPGRTLEVALVQISVGNGIQI